MAGETSKLPKLLQDEINKAIAEGVKAELKKLNSAKDVVPAAEEELSDEKKAAIEMLKGLGFVKQEWISVKDRLPEYDSHFLGYTFGGNMIVGFYWAVEWDKAFGFITHWMPLPEPPYAASQPEEEA